jgi:predicted ATP-grasp superfamily ATP-dependent carboligase
VGVQAGRRPPDGPRVLVTDAQDRPALAAIRSLHAGGYRVTATGTSRLASGLWSRDCARRRVLPDPARDVDGFVDRLAGLLNDDRHDIVVPGTDETLYAVSARRARLPAHVRHGLPDHDVVQRALSKECLSVEASAAGLATPQSRVCRDLTHALDAAREFGFPVLLKGVSTIEESHGRLVRYPTRLIADSAELQDVQPRFGACIVQRRQSGRLMSVAGVATECGLLGSVTSRYLRTWPPSAGQASFLETVVPSDALLAGVQALVAGIGWRGVFQLQLIEGEDGVPRAIDFNPRLYGSMSIATEAGVPLAPLWCDWLLGRNPQPVHGRPGVHYRMDDMDLRHAAWLLRAGDWRGAASALRPRARTTHAYFQARDPLPLLLRGIELVAARVEHGGGRVSSDPG